MSQFFHSKKVVNGILFVRKTWNFAKKDSIENLTSKYVKACPDIMIQNKDIKMFVALLPTLKCFFSVEINLEVIETAAGSCWEDEDESDEGGFLLF